MYFSDRHLSQIKTWTLLNNCFHKFFLGGEIGNHSLSYFMICLFKNWTHVFYLKKSRVLNLLFPKVKCMAPNT